VTDPTWPFYYILSYALRTYNVWIYACRYVTVIYRIKFQRFFKHSLELRHLNILNSLLRIYPDAQQTSARSKFDPAKHFVWCWHRKEKPTPQASHNISELGLNAMIRSTHGTLHLAGNHNLIKPTIYSLSFTTTVKYRPN
jgi:hypothetical protein